MRTELQTALVLARTLGPERLPELLGDLEVVRATAMARLAAPAASLPQPDEQLGVDEAARRLGVSKHYLYRHYGEFSFAGREGRKLVFSSKGIEDHIRKNKP